MASLNFGIKAGQSIGNVELFGMQSETIYTVSTDNERFEVPWDERNDPDTISKVAGYRKHFINLGDDVHEFISDYDAIMYIAEHIKDISDVIKVTGTVEKEPYINKNGDKLFLDKYYIQNIYIPNESDFEGLNINMELFYTKDSIDNSSFKEDKTISVEGFVSQYFRSSKNNNRYLAATGKNLFVPQRTVLAASTVDEKLVKFIVDELKISNGKKVYSMRWNCKLISGPEEVEFDESQLTDKQRAMIELGLKTLEDFMPRGSIYGQRVNEIRIVSPDYIGDYSDGRIEAEVTIKELEEEMAVISEEETLEDIVSMTEKPNPTKVEKSEDTTVDDILGELGL